MSGEQKVDLKDKRAGFWRRHRWLMWAAGAFVAGLGALTGAVIVLAHRAEPMLRARIVQGLEDHFHARVELDSFHLTLREGLWAEGKGLRIWPTNETPGTAEPGAAVATTQAKPLIRLAEFRFHAPLDYDPRKTIRIAVVRLEGLDVDLPPRSHFGAGAMGVRNFAGTSNSAASNVAAPPAGQQTGASARVGPWHFEVESLECEGAHLTIETSKPGKLPLEIAIAHLKLTDVDLSRPMSFEAELTNPRPVGTIHTKGSLGPWLVTDPGESPVSGEYRFEHADLGGFKGIAGILSSIGKYQGTLRELTVDGETDTPDFRLTHFGTAVALHTKFHALVDGTNGDTRLQPVEATLGRSHLWAQGQVVRVVEAGDAKSAPHSRGHDIALMVNVDRGRIEDFLRLTTGSGTPLLTGALSMKASLDIPPGPIAVYQKLKLTGTFTLDDAQFTSEKIQDRIGELSARGQGRPKDAKTNDAADVRSAMTGNFKMASGVVTLPALEYTVPGAVIDLKGTYSVEGGALDFAGTAKMQATVSKMVGGWKGLLLKPMDRYFQKDGAGTVVPIHIDGTRSDPHFGVDLNRMKGTSAQRPDQPQ